MDISLDKRSETSGFIKVSLNSHDYQSDWEKKIKDYGKTAQLRGFRPGKAPFGVVKKFFGKSLLAELIFSKSNQALDTFLKEQKLNILGEPIMTPEGADKLDWDNPSDFEFIYEIGMVSPFQLDLTNLKVPKFNIVVTDKDLNETIENLRKDLGQETEIEAVTADSKVILSLPGMEGAKERSYMVESFDEANKSLIVGKPIETIIRLRTSGFNSKDLVASWIDSEVDSLPEEIEVKIEKILTTTPAEIDQAFFDKAIGEGRVSSEEEFRNEVEKIIQQNYQRSADDFFIDKIFSTVIDSTHFEVPKDFLIKWFAQSNEGSSIEKETAEWDANEKSIRWEIISSRVIESENLTVDREAVLAKTREFFLSQFGGMGLTDSPDMMETLNSLADSYLKKDGGKNMRTMYNRAIADKVLDAIKSKIQVEESSVTFPEFLEKR